MRKAILSIVLVSVLLTVSATDSTHAANVKSSVKEHRELIKKHIYSDFKQMYRQPTGIALIYPYLTPGSKQYANVLWDWDSWLRPFFPRLEAFIKNYHDHHRHAATGLYYWQDDLAIGVDNDPSTFFRPKGSSASIYLNCRDYPCLIQRIGCWSGFMTLWAGIATPEQARRMVKENLLDERTFWGTYGVRTLSKLEKMYNLRATNNPSNWQGPLWGISNYMVWRGLAVPS